MKIGILGGSGHLGKGLVYRWAKNHEILIGSRSLEKAKKMAKEYSDELTKAYGSKIEIKGYINKKAVKESDIVVLSVPFDGLTALLENFGEDLKGKIVISPIVPMSYTDGVFRYTPPKEGSAALFLQKSIPKSAKVIAAFHNVPAKKLSKLDKVLEYDVIVCGDDKKAKDLVFELIREIKNLRPLDGGGLENASLVEPITPLLLNLAKLNKFKLPAVKIVE